MTSIGRLKGKYMDSKLASLEALEKWSHLKNIDIWNSQTGHGPNMRDLECYADSLY